MRLETNSERTRWCHSRAAQGDSANFEWLDFSTPLCQSPRIQLPTPTLTKLGYAHAQIFAQHSSLLSQFLPVFLNSLISSLLYLCTDVPK